MNLYKDTVICAPCGHNCCKECFRDHRLTECPQCDQKIKGTAENKLVDDLVTKFIYKKETLKNFKDEEIWKSNFR